VEGWALEVDEHQVPSLRERLADNNKLWVFCLVAVIAGTLYYSTTLSKAPSHSRIGTVELGHQGKGTFNDEAHTALALELEKIARKRGVDANFYFIDNSRMDLVLPADVALDEISFLSRFAATAIYRRFGNVAMIYAYTKSSTAGDQKQRLAAITRWSEREKNFVTRAQRVIEAQEVPE